MHIISMSRQTLWQHAKVFALPTGKQEYNWKLEVKWVTELLSWGSGFDYSGTLWFQSLMKQLFFFFFTSSFTHSSVKFRHKSDLEVRKKNSWFQNPVHSSYSSFDIYGLHKHNIARFHTCDWAACTHWHDCLLSEERNDLYISVLALQLCGYRQ